MDSLCFQFAAIDQKREEQEKKKKPDAMKNIDEWRYVGKCCNDFWYSAKRSGNLIDAFSVRNGKLYE
jgi:hypothetical protein